MINNHELNAECFDEQDSPQQQYQFFEKTKETPETFQDTNKQSGKADLTTLIVTGAIIIGTAVGAVILGDYFSKKVIPQAYNTFAKPI